MAGFAPFFSSYILLKEENDGKIKLASKKYTKTLKKAGVRGHTSLFFLPKLESVR